LTDQENGVIILQNKRADLAKKINEVISSISEAETIELIAIAKAVQ